MKINVLYLDNLTVFTEYYIGIFILYSLIIFILLIKNIKGLLIQNIIAEFFSIIMLSSCFLIYFDNIHFIKVSNLISFNNHIIYDEIAILSKFILCFFSFIFLLITSEFFKKYKLTFEFLILLLLAILGLIFICTSGHLLLIFLAVELTSLVSYLLAGFRKKSISSVESSIKYLIVGVISSSFFVLGTSFIYIFTGSLLISDYTIMFMNFHCDHEPKSILIEVGLFLVMISIFIKLSLAPFHLWSVDVYENAPTIATFFFSAITKFSFVVLLFRMLSPFIYYYNYLINDFCLTVGLLSIIIGSFGNLQQNRVKIFMAYSSINHMGFIVLALSNFNNSSLIVSIYYLIIYMITNLLLWYGFLLINFTKTKYKLKNSINFSDLILCYKSNPVLAIGFLVGLCSSAGLPPFVGFFAKFQLLLLLIDSNYYMISTVVVLCSIISTFYYLRIVKIIYFENVLVGHLYEPINSNKILIYCLLIFTLIILLIKPNLLYLFIQYFVIKLCI